MALEQTTRLLLPRWTSDDDAPTRQQFNSAFAAIDSGVALGSELAQYASLAGATFTGNVSAPQLSEGNQRVYSPGNPPPATDLSGYAPLTGATFTGDISAPQVFDGAARVYSANNPPPAQTGATVGGIVSLATLTANSSTTTTSTGINFLSSGVAVTAGRRYRVVIHSTFVSSADATFAALRLQMPTRTRGIGRTVHCISANWPYPADLEYVFTAATTETLTLNANISRDGGTGTLNVRASPETDNNAMTGPAQMVVYDMGPA